MYCPLLDPFVNYILVSYLVIHPPYSVSVDLSAFYISDIKIQTLEMQWENNSSPISQPFQLSRVLGTWQALNINV